jgi:hypothetical protein
MMLGEAGRDTMQRRQIDLEDCVNRICPWSGAPVSANSLTLYRGVTVGFCNPGCRDKFELATSCFDSAIAQRAAEKSPG